MISEGPLDENFETLFIELKLHNKKWLLVGTYNPAKSMIVNHTRYLSKCLDFLTPRYENILLFGDFNCEPSDFAISDFCETNNLKNLISVPTCYKSLDNPTCIDLILTNRPRSFQKSTAIETGLSDFHKMAITILKTSFKKALPRVILYRNFRNFSPIKFRQDWESMYTLNDVCDMNNDEFVYEFMKILDIHASHQQKVC